MAEQLVAAGAVIEALSIRIDFVWSEPVQLRPETVEKLRLDLESRAENFLVIEAAEPGRTGLDDVAVSSEARYP